MRISAKRMFFIVALGAFTCALGNTTAMAQGPVTLMGIDAEDGNGAAGSGHGGKQPYTDVATAMLGCVSNGGSGILVLGGGKSAADNVTGFWNAIGANIGQTVTHVNGAGNITAQSLAGFAMIAIPSSVNQTPSGGLTQAENNALAVRANDIANFINGGGGLFGLTQAGLTNQFGYLVIGGGVTSSDLGYSAIDATAAGTAVGITNTNLDVSAWHNIFVSFPAFLSPLALRQGTSDVAAVGGCQVAVPGQLFLTPLTAQNPVGTNHTVTATATDSNGIPLVGVTINFVITSGPNAGGPFAVVTDSLGVANFTYTSNGTTGTDTISASMTDPLTNQTIASNSVAKTWDGVVAVKKSTWSLIKSQYRRE